ncbi:hypothetical protein ACVIWV_007468 [Bradyrhizobium diazoefficiens]
MSRDSFGEGADDGTQEFCEPSQEQAEVVAGRGEDGVDAVTDAAFDPVGRSKSPGYGHLKLPHLMIAVSAAEQQ